MKLGSFEIQTVSYQNCDPLQVAAPLLVTVQETVTGSPELPLGLEGVTETTCRSLGALVTVAAVTPMLLFSLVSATSPLRWSSRLISGMLVASFSTTMYLPWTEGARLKVCCAV